MRYNVDTIYHLASLLSAKGEEQPERCWRVNMDGLRNVLKVAEKHKIKVFWPSSIAVFGPGTPRHLTPQETVLDPTTMYGITKVAGEMLCQYYATHAGVDVRSVRLPGIISYTAPAGGGTTDYAVEIFHEALKNGRYACFVRKDTRLPMMYMPDTIRALITLMEAPVDLLKVRTSYNIAAMSFTAEALVKEIRNQLPDFRCTYEPDFRQSIADTWPDDVDDSSAREEWGWRPEWEVSNMVVDMINNLSQRLAVSDADPQPA